MPLFFSGFQWGRAVPITDHTGRPRYTLLGDAYSLRRRVRVLDLANREAISLEQRLPALFPTYEISVYGKPLGALTRTLHGELLPDLPGWTLTTTGDLLEVFYHGASMALCRQESGGLTIEVENRNSTGLTALGLVLVVKCLMEKR